MCIYIYIYVCREREREREMPSRKAWLTYTQFPSQSFLMGAPDIEKTSPRYKRDAESN